MRRWGIPLGLFVLTCLSTWYVRYDDAADLKDSDAVLQGLTYCAALMGMLLCHEMGHFLVSKRWGVPASLPMFIPMPLTMFGTMGAIIFQGEGWRNRRVLFDIAVAGPLAGLLVALPVAWMGTQQAQIVEQDPRKVVLRLEDPLIMKWMITAIHGPLQPNQDLLLNPLLWAGWFGIFITSINLLPMGQLDGGHICHAIFGRHSRWVSYAVYGGAILMMAILRTYTFAAILVLLALMGVRHPTTEDNDRSSIGWFRTLVGLVVLAFLPLGLTPDPIQIRFPQRPQNQQPGLPVVPQPAPLNRPPGWFPPANEQQFEAHHGRPTGAQNLFAQGHSCRPCR